jgi:hypothetical protein
MYAAPIKAATGSHLDFSGTTGSDLGRYDLELAPELAHFAISLREVIGLDPQPRLDDDFPMRAISLHAAFKRRPSAAQ